MSRHQDQTANHVIESFSFATAAARILGTGSTLAAADIGRVALQSDNNTYWRLLSATPTWQQIAAGWLEYRVTASNATTTGQTLVDITGLVTASGDLAVSTDYYWEA